jgi:hypothetical protein
MLEVILGLDVIENPTVTSCSVCRTAAQPKQLAVYKLWEVMVVCRIKCGEASMAQLQQQETLLMCP